MGTYLLWTTERCWLDNKIIDFILCIIFTPLSLIIDLGLLPLEILGLFCMMFDEF